MFTEKVKNMAKYRMFEGIYPALITPYDAAGCINQAMLEELIEFLINKGVDGLWLCGASSEVSMLTLKERKTIVKRVIRAAKQRIKIIVHVGAATMRDTLDLARHAAENGTDAIASVPPYLYKSNSLSLYQYYTILSREIPLPLLVYHVPGLTDVSITETDMQQFRDVPNLIGIKFSDNDMFKLWKLLQQYGGRWNILEGTDEAMLPALVTGAHGGVGLNYNYIPGHFVSLYRAVREGDLARAISIQSRINQFVRIIFAHGTFATVKYILELKGMDCGNPRLPIRHLDEEEKKEVEHEFDAIGFNANED